MDAYLERLLAIWGHDLNDTSAALTWIENTPAQQEEEGLYLDFKLKSENRSPTVSDTDKKNLAKSISGFANTDGGLVVWGVYAKGEKDNPDVAISTQPISGLKRFVTQLNSLCGQVVTPPMPAVQNRPVPTRPDSDEGYVVTIVPKRRDMLVHANSKLCHGCFIRSGDGFHELHPAIIAEFYSRRPSPNLHLELQLAEPKFHEELIQVVDVNQQGVGKGTFRQFAAVEWNAVLKNYGRGSASHVVLDLRVPESSTCSVISFDFKVLENWNNQPPVVMPLPTARFVDGSSGKILEPIHPGQEIRVASGEWRIPFEAFEADIPDFEVTGFAYAVDSPHFPLSCCKSGTDLRDVLHALRKKAPATTRDTSRPGKRRMMMTEEGLAYGPNQP